MACGGERGSVRAGHPQSTCRPHWWALATHPSTRCCTSDFSSNRSTGGSCRFPAPCKRILPKRRDHRAHPAPSVPSAVPKCKAIISSTGGTGCGLTQVIIQRGVAHSSPRCHRSGAAGPRDTNHSDSTPSFMSKPRPPCTPPRTRYTLELLRLTRSSHQAPNTVV